MTKRLLATTAFAVAAMLALFVPSAVAQQYQPTGTQVLSESAVRAGQTITVSGTGCPANSSVTTTFDSSTVLGSTTADAAGAFSLEVTIPNDATPGVHKITSTCGDVVLSSNVTVLGQSVVAPPGNGTGGAGTPLARTGTNSAVPLTQIAVGLLAIGGVLLIVARKKRNPATA